MKKRDKRLRATPEKRMFKVGENVKSELKGILTVVFVNVGLGRQTTASRFLVHLVKGKLPCSEIEERLVRAFSDLK